MTQTARSQEKNENFSQIANVLIQGYPELDIQDRYVPIALASVCWEEKFYPLSLRQIASITRVNHTSLKSRAGQHPREGVLDRLKRVGILDFREEKPTDPTTGKEGRSQTYICIRYSNIWKENTKFFAGKKAVKIAASVDVVNSDTHKSVDVVNHTVDVVNHTVDVVNHTVDGACSNAAHNTMNTKNTINTIEDSKVVSASASTCSPSLPLPEKNLLSEDTPEQANVAYSHDQPATDLQEKGTETVSSVESSGYRQESKPVDPPAKPVKPASRQRKPKVEQPVLVDTSKKAVAYNEAEQRVFDWYCGCDFIHAKPEQDANKKKHCGKLALHVHSQEEMQSLADFTKTWVKEHFKQNVYVVPLGNMAYSDTLNAWIAKQKQAKRVSEPAAPQEIDLNKPVLWTRYQHTGPAIKHWFLYEDMPFVEAQQYGYKPDVIVPNDRRNIHTSLKALAEGHQTLTPEEQNEKDHAELRLHLVA